MESHFDTMKTKWLAANYMTLADFVVGAHILRLAYNPKYKNKHIIESIIGKYPKSKAWAENFRDFAMPWFEKNNQYPYW